MSKARLTPAAQAARLGTDPLGPLLWRSASQTTASVATYGVYALTNAWFVAWGVGPTALAAVNLVTPVLLLLGAVATTVGVGGASLVSRALGAGRVPDAARATGNAFVVFWSVAITVTVFGLIFTEPILDVLGAHGEIRDDARAYYQILVSGAIFSTGFSTLVRAEGRMFFSTMLWMTAVGVQIVLDPIFIFGLDLGIRGAALGTVGGQFVSACMCWWFFFIQKNRPYRIGFAALRPRLTTLKQLVTLGAPSFLAGFGATILAVVLNNQLMDGGGALVLAAYAVGARVQTFMIMPQTGISQGMQPIVGYNHGLRRQDRVTGALRLSLASSLAYSVVAAAVIAALAHPVAALFLKEPEEIDLAARALRILCVGIAVSGVVPLVAAYYQSIGQPKPAYLLAVGTLLAIKLPLVLIVAQVSHADPTSLWWAIAAGEIGGAAVAGGALWYAKRRT